MCLTKKMPASQALDLLPDTVAVGGMVVAAGMADAPPADVAMEDAAAVVAEGAALVVVAGAVVAVAAACGSQVSESVSGPDKMLPKRNNGASERASTGQITTARPSSPTVT
jgi:hypothetical protein